MLYLVSLRIIDQRARSNKGLGDWIMKKIKGCVPVLISAVLLSGCVKNDIKMTDEQIDRAAEYAAGILLKYDKNYESTLSDENEVLKTTTNPEQEENNIDLETTKPENNNQTGLNTSDEPNKTAQSEKVDVKTISELINIKDCEINFLKMQLLDNYQQNNTLYLKADKGKKLAVLEFEIKNNSNSDKKIKLLKKKISYTLQTEGGGEYQPDLSILVNDLQFYNEKIQKGKSGKAVLVFSIPEKESKNIVKLQVISGKQKAEVKVK